MSVTAFNRRRRELAAQKAAAEAKPEPAPAPEVGTAEHYASLNVDEVIEAVEAGIYTVEQALEFEGKRSKPRKGIVDAFPQKEDDEPEEGPQETDKEPDEAEATGEDESEEQ